MLKMYKAGYFHLISQVQTLPQPLHNIRTPMLVYLVNCLGTVLSMFGCFPVAPFA